MSRHRTHRPGFTIIEVMIVLVIIGVIGGIVGLNLIGAQSQAKVSATKATMKQVVQALKMYYSTNNNYPPSATWQQEIRNTLNAPADDAWGNPLAYYQTDDGKGFMLYSNGEDGMPETEDDIMVGPDHE